jgi:hypothetical protein
MNHESLADSFSPELWPDKEVFQEESVPSLPSGVVVEEEGHSGWLAIQLSDNCSEFGMGGETIPDQVFFFGSNRTGFSLILRQLADER